MEKERKGEEKDRRVVVVVKMKFVSVACSYQCTRQLTITDMSSLLSSSVTSTIFLSLSTSFPSASFSTSQFLPLLPLLLGSPWTICMLLSAGAARERAIVAAV